MDKLHAGPLQTMLQKQLLKQSDTGQVGAALLDWLEGG